MNKKSAITLAVGALFAAPALAQTSEVQIYGRAYPALASFKAGVCVSAIQHFAGCSDNDVCEAGDPLAEMPFGPFDPMCGCLEPTFIGVENRPGQASNITSAFCRGIPATRTSVKLPPGRSTT